MYRICVLFLMLLFSGCGLKRDCLYLYKPYYANGVCKPYFELDNEFFFMVRYNINVGYWSKYPENISSVLVYYSSYDSKIVIPASGIYRVEKIRSELLRKEMMKNGIYEYKFLYLKENNEYKPVLPLEKYNYIAIQKCFDEYCLTYPLVSNGVSYYVKRKDLISVNLCNPNEKYNKCINDSQ
ncbi:hypothetical protein [Campylobacter mucosalis]|uniref:Lipoprotein n=1 Tax=Campylobacter mucosalis CCUG 21559 TaxID=1032067 RepID=A0A6G5QJ62_9BACT|nr:hypothetical protein [Campylobacter mucosalis]QCD45659.1 hypothetical protein CMUC_1918 [Campylobacter mucosalis CCUG 21559]